MSVFIKEGADSFDDGKKVSEKNPILEYYSNHLDSVVPVPLYKNTKFMTLDKINGGLLTEKEKAQFTDSPTGYNFNLKDSGYLVVDVDIDGYFSKIAFDDIDKTMKMFGVDSFPDKITIVEWLVSGKRKKIESTNFANIAFSTLFKTPYVLTPSKGFHYYFKNDLTEDQLTELFGFRSARYIKCIDGFSDVVSIDIFADNKKDDAYIVLPFTNIIIENEKYKVDQENNYKTINVSYSGFRYTVLEDGNTCDFQKASVLLEWLKKNAIKREKQPKKVYDAKYSERGKVVGVNEMNKAKYIKWMVKNFNILAAECGTISTFASKPFNLYQLMSFIAYFPVDMHEDLLRGFADNLMFKLSDNAKAQLLTYYYHLAHDENKEQDLKHPRYFESIMNKTYDLEIDNKYIFEHEKDENPAQNEDEEVIEDESDTDRTKEIEAIIKAIGKRYKDLKMPSL